MFSSSRKSEKAMIRKSLIKLSSAAALVAMSLTAMPLVAVAGPADKDVVSEKVDTSGLNLNTREGAEKLIKRLSSAAINACGVESKFDPLRTAKFDHCYQDTLSSAIRAVNRPLVSQIYAGHNSQAAANHKDSDVYASSK
jgi:UrcA family protein